MHNAHRQRHAITPAGFNPASPAVMQVRPISVGGGVPRVVGASAAPPAGVDPGFSTSSTAGLRTADQIDFSADARLLAAGLQAERDGMVLDVVDRSLEASRERREENQARAAEHTGVGVRVLAGESDARRETRLEESVQRDARYEQMLAKQQGAARTGSVIDVVA